MTTTSSSQHWTTTCWWGGPTTSYNGRKKLTAMDLTRVESVCLQSLNNGTPNDLGFDRSQPSHSLARSTSCQFGYRSRSACNHCRLHFQLFLQWKSEWALMFALSIHWNDFSPVTVTFKELIFSSEWSVTANGIRNATAPMQKHNIVDRW